MDSLMDIIKEMNVAQLLAIGVMFWFFYSKIERKFEKMERKFEKIEERFEKIESQLNNIDKRVFAIETMLHMKDCCMLKDDRQGTRKAE